MYNGIKIKLRQGISIISIVIISLFILVGCSDKKEIENTVENYTKLLNEEKYGELYETLLTKDSMNYIREEYGGKGGFVKKYSTIYSAMGVKNIKVDVSDVKSKSEVYLNISFDTIAGNLKYEDVEIKLEKSNDEYKLSWDEGLILPDMVQGDKVRVQIIKGNRGEILDRDGNKLAYNDKANYVNIDLNKFDKKDIKNLAKTLDISEEYIENKIGNHSNSDYAVNIVKLSKYEDEKLEKVSKIEGINIQEVDSRVYEEGEAFGSLIGYVGDITAEELEKHADENYTTTSQIGKNGLEQVYESKLRATDGVHIYIEGEGKKVDVAKIDKKDGQDIKLSIDSTLQKTVYEQMDKQKGASVGIDPTTGEVVAMVSSPSYDSNTMVTYKTKTIAKEWQENKNACFDNRTNNLYSPGSTMKLITASIGLDNNVINPAEKMKIEGLNWQKSDSWGNYKVTRVKDLAEVDLYDAIVNSDNIYFAEKAIKIGSEKLIEGAKKFALGDDIDFEYPMPKTQISNNNKIDKEVLLADTGYGQGEVLTTPLQITMSYSALANNGKIMVPRLVISENSKAKVYSQAIAKENLEELQKDFSGVIEDSNGSGYLCKIEGVKLAGKTGTAEIKSTKDDTTGDENSWFVAVDLEEPKLAISMVMENMKEKSTSQDLVPKVKNIIKSYISENK